MSRRCLNSPFRAEELRRSFAERNDYFGFNETYSGKYPEINNKNTGKFWDKKFFSSLNNSSTRNGNFMEINKIDDVFCFLKKERGKLLDLGIGLGQLEEKLHKANKNIKFWGVDNSTLAINRIRERIPGNFINCSVFDLRLEEEIFDIVCCLDLLEHISPSKTFILLNKIFRLLKSNGKLIITVPLNEGLEEMVNKGLNPNCHVRVYFPETLETELKLAHFNICYKKYYTAFRKMYKFKSFVCNHLKGFRKPNLMLIVANKNNHR